MKFNLGRREERNLRDLVGFLRCPAIDFYSNKLEFDDPDYSMFVKSTLLNAFNDAERTIKGTFNCDLGLREVKYTMFKKMFPVACNVLKIDSADGLKKAGYILSSLRNINAHAVISEENKNLFKTIHCDYFKMKQTVTNVNFYCDGGITMGGIVNIALLFLRAESIMHLSKGAKFISLMAGCNIDETAKSFIADVNHVNLEIPIRKKPGSEVLSSIVGEYSNKIKPLADGDYVITFDGEEDPTFKVQFLFENGDTIVVKKSSVTKVYYQKDYKLVISDKEGFKKLSNKLPPFVFVDLLFKLGINEFNEDAYNAVNAKFEKLYSKLNYPKFYIDKTIDILLLPPKMADFRITSYSVTDELMNVFLKLENQISIQFKHVSQDAYSHFKDSLIVTGVDKELANAASDLRNAAAHRMVLGETSFVNEKLYTFTLEKTFAVLIDLQKFYQRTNSQLFEVLKKTIREDFVRRLISIRYNAVVEYSLMILDGEFDSFDQKTRNKFLYVDSSIYTHDQLNSLFLNDKPDCLIAKYVIEGDYYPRYIRNNEEYIQLMDEYLRNNGHYEKHLEKDEGVAKILFYKEKD